MEVKVVLRKTQQRNNLDEELKDKYETRVHNYYQLQLDMILELQLYLLYFLHVMFSNHSQLILFHFSGGKKRNKEGTLAEDHKVQHQTA